MLIKKLKIVIISIFKFQNFIVKIKYKILFIYNVNKTYIFKLKIFFILLLFTFFF